MDQTVAIPTGQTVVVPTATVLEGFAIAWNAAKADEQAANARRVEIERSMIALVQVKPEGASTYEAGAFKVTLTGKLDRKIDLAAFDALKSSIVPALWPIKTVRELDVVGAKWLEQNDPAVWGLIAPCITTKPAKTAVAVKPAKE